MVQASADGDLIGGVGSSNQSDAMVFVVVGDEAEEIVAVDDVAAEEAVRWSVLRA